MKTLVYNLKYKIYKKYKNKNKINLKNKSIKLINKLFIKNKKFKFMKPK